MKSLYRPTNGRQWVKTILVIAASQLLILPAQGQPNNTQGCGVTDKNSQPYFAKIRANVRALVTKNSAASTTTATTRTAAVPSVKFSWPLRDTRGTEFSYYGINNYVDLEKDTVLRDANGNYLSGLKEYNCGTRTYDGHNGLDIDLRPYSWKMMNDQTVWVIAAADGVIVDGDDGNTDNNCDLDGYTGPTWGNYLALMHDDSTISVYIHMKKSSVIPVTVGQRIARGDFLGYVASSGRSTNPHLHFGVYINNKFNTDGSVNDYKDLHEPFYGSCNTSLPSFWQSQKPYNEPSVIAIETHNFFPGVYSSNCDKTVDLYFDKTFSAGDIVYSRTWFRDWVDGSVAVIQLLSPSGTILSNSTRSNANNGRQVYKDENFLLSSSAALGTYTVRVTFDGKIRERYFIVGCVQNYTVSGTLTGPKGYIAGNSITTTQVIESGSDNKVEYHSDGEIVFGVGFHAKAGSVVIADRKGCTGGYN